MRNVAKYCPTKIALSGYRKDKNSANCRCDVRNNQTHDYSRLSQPSSVTIPTLLYITITFQCQNVLLKTTIVFLKTINYEKAIIR